QACNNPLSSVKTLVITSRRDLANRPAIRNTFSEVGTATKSSTFGPIIPSYIPTSLHTPATFSNIGIGLAACCCYRRASMRARLFNSPRRIQIQLWRGPRRNRAAWRRHRLFEQEGGESGGHSSHARKNDSLLEKISVSVSRLFRSTARSSG